ncbi:MAG: HlyC/CorC family transporter [Chloroflexi bacterium]|nr:HlyC/CorC family transporter [Chloroflexota bacterium]
MGEGNSWLVVVFVIVLILSAFFSAAEAAFLSVQRSRLAFLVRSGVKGAQRVADVIAHPERLLPTVLTGNNLVNTTAAAIGTAIAISILGPDEAIAIVAATVVVTIILLVFGEIIPKTIATHHSERLAIFFVGPLKVAESLLLPFVWALEHIARGLVRLFGVSGAKMVAEEEIRALIDTGKEEGGVEPQEAQMLERVFEFGDREVREMMTPRTEIVAVEKGATLEEFFLLYTHHAHTRFPIYEGNLDNVLGTLSTKEVLHALAVGALSPKDDVTRLLRPAYFVPDTKRVAELFRELRGTGYQMVMVADEFGGVAGLATLKQMVEEVVGRVGEEGMNMEEDYKAIDENTFQVEGNMRVSDANDYMDLGIPHGEYETVAGFLLSRMGRIPKEGDRLLHKGHVLEVTAMKGVKIEQLKVTKAATDGSQPP